jgi:hypothetical protein
MRLVSFDVGIKNLAYCVFSIPFSTPTSQPLPENTWSISEWNCANLIAQDSPAVANKPCCQPIKGKRKSDGEHPCNKQSKWIVPDDPDMTYCEMHAKTHGEWIIPKRQHTTSHINKLKLPELEKEYSSLFPNESSDSSSKKKKKSELVERITKHYESKCFRGANENIQKSKTAGEIDLVTIGRAIRRQLDEDPATMGVTHVVIENQISTIAARMKTIQGMIAQYFIMRFGDQVHIEFVSSHNKLKGFSMQKNGEGATKAEVSKNDKTSYKANKSDGIDICRRFIDSNPEMREWETVFEKSKKRDDLADCFLQGIWYLKSNKIISYAENLKINSVILS